ncbi:MAG: NAD(P)-binding domain-containing protein [Planctomycetota bacterium]
MKTVCVIGAGTSGLAALKRLTEAGVAAVCYEAHEDLGGNWNIGSPASSINESTHLISSKELTEYNDYPMPERFPDFPGHAQVIEYLLSYVEHFDLRKDIQFQTEVLRIEPLNEQVQDSGWRVELSDGTACEFAAVVIANGHNWDPRWPEYPGEFTGEVLHSSQYKRTETLRDKRVLVVGGGNSGCDIAAEAAVHARHAELSWRRGYHVLPKFFRGVPIDQWGDLLHRLRLPLWLRRRIAMLAARWALGPNADCAMPTPDHRLFETHPIINSQLHHHVGHGRLTLRPDIERFEGNLVYFVDGSQTQVDLVVFATGFKLTMPFLEDRFLPSGSGNRGFYLNIFHPERDDLFIAGMIQPDSGQWGLVDDQALAIARFLTAKKQDAPAASRLRADKRKAAECVRKTIAYVDSPRHDLEVEYYAYRRSLRRLQNQLQ